MRFFNNSAINRTYIQAALQTFAENVGGVFVFVYMIKAGISVPIVFASLAAIFLMRIVLRQLVLPVVKRIGLRDGLILGTLLVALSYLLVAYITSVGPLLIFFIVFDALSTSFYWTCYHAYVAKLGDNEHRGSQVSVREAINAIMGIVAPLLGSFLLIYVGSGSAFLVAAGIEALAILPMIGAPNHRIADHAVIDVKAKQYAQRLFFTDGLITSSFFFMWIIALFQTLGGNYGSYGGTLALAGLIGAVVSLMMGRLIDLGHHKRSVQIAYVAISLSIIIKAFAYSTPWAAVAATAVGAIASPLYMPVMMSRIYNMAKRATCPLRFQVAAEGAWDLGTGLGCLMAAVFLWMGLSYFIPIMFGLVACVMGFRIMIQAEPN